MSGGGGEAVVVGQKIEAGSCLWGSEGDSGKLEVKVLAMMDEVWQAAEILTWSDNGWQCITMKNKLVQKEIKL